MTPVLELEELAVGYGDRVVVSGISLRVQPGQVVGILGGNGAGKTTILRAVYGRARVFGGSIRVAGLEAAPRAAHSLAACGVGILLQGEIVFPSLTVRENLHIAVRTRRPEFDRRVTALLDVFPEIAPLLSKTAGVLSGGERQIVGVCRALVSEPRLLLLDEPGAGLSPALVSRLLGRLLTLARERQIAALIVEQHIAAALDVVDRVVVVREGRQVFEGAAADLSPSAAIAALLGQAAVGVAPE
jgi:ABC-type branched-subunit amino acid transport system ATPase component